MYTGSGVSGDYFGAGESKTWLLGIGSKFGVTNNGEIYATAGKIGGWALGSDSLKAGSSE
jgi:hypothetical protein